MLGLIVLLLIGGILWMLWAPSLAFVPGFAALLEKPAGQSGALHFLKGSETIGGQFQGRTVLLILHHKRGRHSVGYLVVAMQPASPERLAATRTGAFREWFREPAARGAWDDLELNRELKLSFEDGWVRALWRPTGLRMFPGTFEAAHWRAVLQHLHTLVTSLERDSTAARPS